MGRVFKFLILDFRFWIESKIENLKSKMTLYYKRFISLSIAKIYAAILEASHG